MPERKWYTLSLSEIYEELNSNPRGLSSDQASEKTDEYGKNKLKEEKKISPIALFLEQFKDFLILILVIAATISLILGHQVDFYLIIAIVIGNGVFGFIQDWKAEQSIQALKEMATAETTVYRDGKRKVIDIEELVPGDVISLEQGSTVPADARLMDQQTLKVDESALTGESEAVQKTTDVIKESSELAEQSNMVFKHTNIVRGRGKAIVVSTGMETEIGKVARQLQEVEQELTPFQKEVNELGKKLGILLIGISALIVPISILFHGTGWLEAFLTAVALAVAAIPEGLPAVVTLALAMGTRKMVDRNALTRRLTAVESLGSVDTICTDKTGTLTENEMSVQQMYTSGAERRIEQLVLEKDSSNNHKHTDQKLLLEAGVLCNDAELQDQNEMIGDPTEVALLKSATRAGLNLTALKSSPTRIKEIPFSSKRKMMTAVYRNEEVTRSYTKGAPEIVLEKSNNYWENGEIKPLTVGKREEFQQKIESMASGALRVLGFATKDLHDGNIGDLDKTDLETNLTFIGLQGMIDPPREEVKEAIGACRDAGIKTVMVTGDNALTATAIGKELGFTGKVLTGKDLNSLTDSELREKVPEVTTFARVSPSDKLKILNIIKEEKGHIVAMTGDGVNDAPSLKRSDVGISMGIRGTDVAKQASDIVLLDDNFASIKDAIAEGRAIFDNIRKFVSLLLSGNLAEVLTVFLATLLGLGLPLTAPMLLWVNLLTDGLPAVALGADGKSKGVMERKPREKGEGVINKHMVFVILGIGLSLTGLILLSFHHMLPNMALARTVAFTELVLIELIEIVPIRTSFGQPIKKNLWLYLAVLSSITFQFVVIYSPINKYFGLVPLGLYPWLVVLGAIVIFSIFIWIYIKIGQRIFGRSG